ncbi:hypothetical protein EUGRSUZ_H01530 [Eucalyptus grandis]|uniref:Uncharacterized protein n=2 Tax=Eucalyptus grandis TaxID=71139 RepID=A0ACC3JNQ9_EUCGR|nr:hypothetical protein EUGRSUZ_H01530 [Eucalyptus grandis]
MRSSSMVFPNEEGGEGAAPKTLGNYPSTVAAFLRRVNGEHDLRRVVHGIKVGIALVLASIVAFITPAYNIFETDAVWAVMTVVVMFEFYAGAALSKGLNRAVGTLSGGMLGCMSAVLAKLIDGKVGQDIGVGTAVFIFGAAATYVRSIPCIKRKYDYGGMIFILSFSLVAVSSVQFQSSKEILKTATERLQTVMIGFAATIFTSLFIFPIWAGDELHVSIASKFEHLACSMEGLLDTYFDAVADKESKGDGSCKSCRPVLNSKAKDESLANFAKWEPWHRRFGLFYPWDKYLKVGELLRELAATIVSLDVCVQSSRQPAGDLRQSIKEPCELVASSLARTLRELGESLMNMRRCQSDALVLRKLRSSWLVLRLYMSPTKLENACNSGEDLAISTFVFLLTEMLEKLERLANEVEELGELAKFKINDM